MNPVIETNLKRMTSSEKGGMMRLIERESIGGNAGTHKRYPPVPEQTLFITLTAAKSSISTITSTSQNSFLSSAPKEPLPTHHFLLQ